MKKRCGSAMLVVILAVVAMAESMVAQSTSCTDQLPVNLIVEPLYQSRVVNLLERSPTLRRQCLAIAGAAQIEVVVISSPLADLGCRARASIRKTAAGRIRAELHVPARADYAELLAHEFEHVLEQIEGLDLAGLARVRSSGVREVAPNVFETTRAHAAGRVAAREVFVCRNRESAGCGERVPSLTEARAALSEH